MKKLIDLPPKTISSLKRMAKKKKMRVKPLMELIIIEGVKNDR